MVMMLEQTGSDVHAEYLIVVRHKQPSPVFYSRVISNACSTSFICSPPPVLGAPVLESSIMPAKLVRPRLQEGGHSQKLCSPWECSAVTPGDKKTPCQPSCRDHEFREFASSACSHHQDRLCFQVLVRVVGARRWCMFLCGFLLTAGCGYSVHACVYVPVTDAQVGLGTVTLGVWRRFSEFKRLAMKLSASRRRDQFHNALCSWRCLRERQRWFRCVFFPVNSSSL